VSEFSWDRYNREIFQPNIVDPIADVFRHRDELSLTGMLGDAVRGVGSSYRDAFPQPRMDDPNPFRHRTDEEMIRSLWEWLPASSFSAGMLPDAGRQGGKVLVSGMFSKGAKKPWEKSEENLDFLHNSAKKYKTAEEFVEAIGEVMYQGRSTKGLTTLIKDGEGWFSKDRGVAVQFADMLKHNKMVNSSREAEFETIPNKELKGEVYERVILSKNHKEVDIQETLWNRQKERAFIKQAKEEGHDALKIMRDGEVKDIVVFDPSQIKTKQQLTDIWNKANRADPGETLSEENLDFLQRIPR